MQRVPPQIGVAVTGTSIQLKSVHLLSRTGMRRPHKQLVVFYRRIPINQCGLDAPLRNDARHGPAAVDEESPKLPGMKAPKYQS